VPTGAQPYCGGVGPFRESRLRETRLQPVAAGVQIPETRPVAYERQLEGMRVLVVDDNKDVRESTTHMLTRWGCNVRASERFPEFEAVDDTDFMICDEELGDQRGLSMIRQLRARSGRAVPTAIATGVVDATLREQAAADQIVVLSKPVRPAQLRSLLLAARAQSATMPQGAAGDGFQ